MRSSTAPSRNRSNGVATTLVSRSEHRTAENAVRRDKPEHLQVVQAAYLGGHFWTDLARGRCGCKQARSSEIRPAF